MSDGFIRLNRKFFDHFLWKEPRDFCRADAWLDLLNMVAFEDHQRLIAGKLVTVPRGSIVTAERFLATRWGWSRTKLRTFFQLLTDAKMVTLEKDRENTTVILCNYDTYNNQETTKRPQKNHKKTAGEPPEDQRKEGEEGKEVEPKGSTPSRATREELTTYVVGELGMLPTDAEHIWNVWEENGWTRSQAGKRVPIKNWKLAANTWKTGNYFPSQKTQATPRPHANNRTLTPRPALVPGGEW